MVGRVEKGAGLVLSVGFAAVVLVRSVGFAAVVLPVVLPVVPPVVLPVVLVGGVFTIPAEESCTCKSTPLRFERGAYGASV